MRCRATLPLAALRNPAWKSRYSLQVYIISMYSDQHVARSDARRDSLGGHSSRRSPRSKTGNGFGGNGSDLVFCSLKKNATLDKFRNKRKVGCRLLHGEDGRAARARKGGSERKERRGCRGWPRPYRERVEPRKNHKSNDLPVTPRTWRPIRRRSTKTMKRVMRPNKRRLWVADRRNDFFYMAVIYRRLNAGDV